ncbi:SCO6880 family protein [Demequina lutea]|uniref:Type IV secretory pathway, VirB4 component n=1 Tax=Demequina lutea TaxID=431489 RepID=A0A7Z0CLL4_9MICO|nr:SCO6880 family protein [Demequina lutea]NYI42885.1 hypothetical protein [Demequina lutea]
MSDEVRTSLIGGDEGDVSMFGGMSKDQVTMIFGTVGVGFVFILFGAVVPALGIMIVGGGLGFLLTIPTASGTLASKAITRLRWVWRRVRGTDRFEPYSDAKWEAAQGRKERVALRARPDGADAMVWLQSGAGQPGIAWHRPLGEEEYLSVAFSVEGILQGLESQAEIEASSEAWGNFLAGYGGGTSLVREVQTITRVLPPDMAYHMQWLRQNLHPTEDNDVAAGTMAVLRQSYAQVLDVCERGALVQRHFVVLRWPISQAFTQQAAHFGAYHEGWLDMMRQEVDAALRALAFSGMGAVSVLTARQTAAMMLHQQDPSRPLDKVSDVEPDVMALSSHDVRGACVTKGADREYWHATAMIRSSLTGNAPRTTLWTLPVLTGMRAPIVRTMSFHLRLIPAMSARGRAESDAARAHVEVIEANKRGRLDSLEAQHQRDTALRRMNDLRPGSRHQGVEWVGFVTITSESAEGLGRDKRIMEEHVQTGLGINRLLWMDTMHSAAMGTTWPIARGVRPRRAALFDQASAALDRA